MKKITQRISLFLLLMGIGMPFAATAQTFTSDTEEGIAVNYKVLTADSDGPGEGKGTVTIESKELMDIPAIDITTVGKVTIPATVTNGDNTYDVTQVSMLAFAMCFDVTEIVLPESVTTFATYALAFCGIESFKVPSGVKILSDYTFSGCTALESITLPNGLTTLGEKVFDSCSSLAAIDLPETITSLGQYVFNNCSGLTNVSIPASVNLIGKKQGMVVFEVNPFAGCVNLQEVIVPESSASFCSVNGVLFNKAKTTLFTYPPAKTASEYEVPITVTSIVNKAFKQCFNLATLSFPGSINNFSNDVFEGNTTGTFILKDGTIWVKEGLLPYYESRLNGRIDASAQIKEILKPGVFPLTLTVAEDGSSAFELYFGTRERAAELAAVGTEDDNIELDKTEVSHMDEDKSVNVSSAIVNLRLRSGSTNKIDNANVTVSFDDMEETEYLIPVAILSDPFEGLGTEESPYLINNIDDLALLARLVNEEWDDPYNGGKYYTKHYRMTDDIDLAGFDSDEDAGNGNWTPIGNHIVGTTYATTLAFRGVFDGGGFSVKNMVVNQPEIPNRGLFGYATDCVIKNLGVVDCNVKGWGSVGAVAGSMGFYYDAFINTVTNCYSSGTVEAANNCAGGLVGFVQLTDIENCYSTCTVIADRDLGGLVAPLTGATLRNCYSTGTITATGVKVSDKHLVGGMASIIQDVSQVGTEDMPTRGSIIENCFATGAITAGKWIGGIVGFENNVDEIWTVRNNVALSPSILSNFTPAEDDHPANILYGRIKATGFCDVDSILTNNYAFKDMTIKHNGNDKVFTPDHEDIDGGDVIKEQLWTTAFWTNLGFTSDNWDITAGKHLRLKSTETGQLLPGQPTEWPEHLLASTEPEPVLIANQVELKQLADDVAAGETFEGVQFKLTADITLDLSNATTYPTGWTPIGTPDNPFMGSFDGDGHIIKGLIIDTEGTVGLFGSANGGVIENLGLVNVNIKGTESVGALVGMCGSTVKNCFSTGKVSGLVGVVLSIGGLIGDMFPLDNPVSIENSYSQCDVEVLGNDPSTEESYNVVAGGLIGAVYGVSIINCYASGTVTIQDAETEAGQHIGGITVIGDDQSSISNSAALNAALVFNPTNDMGYDDMEARFARIASVPPFADITLSLNVALETITGIYLGEAFPFDDDLSQNGMSIDMESLQLQYFYNDLLGWKFGTDAENPWKIEEGNWPVLWFTPEPEQPDFLYHEDDKAALRAFLIQESADFETDGLYNYHRLGLTDGDVATWEDEEGWVEKLPEGTIWSTTAPKRLLKIGTTNANTPTPWGKKNLAGTLDLSECKELTYLYIERNSITSINVQGLTKLTSLYCPQNKLTSLDLTDVPLLDYLNCEYNDISELKITGLSMLGRLFCEGNELEEIDFTGTTNVVMVYAQVNYLKTLDVSGLTKMTTLNCSSSELTSLKLPESDILTTFWCHSNQLTELDVSKLPKLTSFRCGHNLLTELDVSMLTELTYLNCNFNQLKSLDLSKLTALRQLECDDNKLTELNIEGLEEIWTLECQYNQLTELNISHLSKLRIFDCGENQLKFSTLPPNWGDALYVSDTYYYAPQDTIKGGIIPYDSKVDLSSEATINNVSTVYTWFDISEGKTDVSELVTNDGTGKFTFDESLAGKKLRCQMTNSNFWKAASRWSQLTLVYEVSLSEVPAEPLYHEDDKLALHAFLIQESADFGIDGLYNYERLGLTAEDMVDWETQEDWVEKVEGVSWTASPEGLRIGTIDWDSYSLAGELDLSKCEFLTTLWCKDNQLSKLISGGGTKFGSLDCGNNKLTVLDVSESEGLKSLDCANNQLTNLDLSNNTALLTLDCSGNQLTKLDLSSNPNIKNFYCNENHLTEIKLSPDAQCKAIYCQDNRLKFSSLPPAWGDNAIYAAIKTYYYAPQATIQAGLISSDSQVDLSSEATINGIATIYTWYDITDSKTNVSEFVTNDGTGKFTFDASLAGKTLRCEMSNENFWDTENTTNRQLTLVYEATLTTIPVSTYTITLPETMPAGISAINYTDNTSVVEGGSFTFSLVYASGYGQIPTTVRVNNVVLAPISGNTYRISNITENKTVTIADAEPNPVIPPVTYVVTIPGSMPVGISAINYTDNTRVDEGGSFTFTLVYASGYGEIPTVVKVNNTVLSPTSGTIYKISNITEDKTITIADAEPNPVIPPVTYVITLPGSMPVGISAINYTDNTRIDEGGNFTFTLVYASGYGEIPTTVKVNNAILSPISGTTYTISNIKEDKVVEIADAKPNPVIPPVTYKVNISILIDEELEDCVSIDPPAGEYEVEENEFITISLSLNNECDIAIPEVYVNGELVEATGGLRSASYEYRIKVTGILFIEVKGIEKNQTTIETPDKTPKISTIPGWILIEAYMPAGLRVYTISGQLIIDRRIPEGSTSIPIPRGLYILKLDDLVRKIVIE